MKARGLLASLALMASLVPASPMTAHANNGGNATCGTASGKTYTSAAQCHLMFRGFPLIVRGDAGVSNGEARVHVWLTLYNADSPAYAIVECEQQASRFAECGTGFPDSTTRIDNYALEQTSLVCHVESRGTGTYTCSSGNGV